MSLPTDSGIPSAIPTCWRWCGGSNARGSSTSPFPRNSMYSKGWFQVAFERDLAGDLTPASIGTVRLVLARMASGVRAFAADCPHRGAHLALGGRLDSEA